MPAVLCGAMQNSTWNAFIIMGIYAGIFLLIRALPVNCSTGICTGRMRMHETRVSFWKMQAHFECEDCKAVYDQEYFWPEIQVEVSG